MAEVLAIEDITLSKAGEKRYVIIDKETREILDNAQGYGYKTPQKAYSAYWYLTKGRTPEAQEKRKHIREWLKTHKSFVNALDGFALDIAKGAGAPDEKIDAEFVEWLLKEYDLTIDFTAKELLSVWKRW